MLKYASKINPLTYGVDSLKHVITPMSQGALRPDFTLTTDLTVLACMSLLFIAISSWRFGRIT